jgi:hypothetical protein
MAKKNNQRNLNQEDNDIDSSSSEPDSSSFEPENPSSESESSNETSSNDDSSPFSPLSKKDYNEIKVITYFIIIITICFFKYIYN